jgi:2-dehydro-3-deoxyphosphogluconate aldolase/(4S)-4-hydroxy-2-oxoglutarate aldolase
MTFIRELERHKLVAILRGLTEEQGNHAAEALYQGGIRFLEITMNTSGYAAMIRQWRQQYEGKMWIGAGTVLDIGMAKEAHTAGAQFLVTPNTDREVIEYAVNHQLPILPGAMTPTEIVEAWKAGATAVKLFPMSSLGIQYFKEVRAPLDLIRLLPTGGISKDNIGDYIQAGAFGFGMGSSLVDKKAIIEGRYEALTERAQELIQAIHVASNISNQ